MDSKILILGGTGMAGHMIYNYLKERSFDVYYTSRNKQDLKSNYFNPLENLDEVQNIFDELNPSYVINCIGLLNKDAELVKSRGIFINSYLPHYLDELSKEYNFKLIHISTDCVFSGLKGNYTELDVPDSNTFYGMTKALGEIKTSNNLTLRTSIVGPDINKNGIGLFSWFMKQESAIKGFKRVIWTGVTTLQLAKTIEFLLKENISGLYHLVNNKKISKYELLTLFNKYTKKNLLIEEDNLVVCDKSLLNKNVDTYLEIPDYELMIKEMVEWIKNHKDLYGGMYNV